MISRMHTPGPPLSEFVRFIWLMEGCPTPNAYERVLPNGEMGLIVNLFEDSTRLYDARNLRIIQKSSGAIVCGARTSADIVDAAELRDTMGVVFKPGGAFPFFKPPSAALEELQVDLQDLWGRDGRLLRERLLEARNPEEKFQIMERVLLQQAVRPLEKHPAVRFAAGVFQRAPQLPISRALAETGLSERRFIQLFADQVGLTPKLFCRVRRFQLALQKTFGREMVDWAEIAADSGYFDQPHFIHDFTKFSGLTPSSYLRQRQQPGNHVPLAV
jgi:AraC-like DNA-binding protein